MFSFENRLRMDFEHIKQKEDETMESTLKVTSQMFRTVFVAVKKNIPLSTHSVLWHFKSFMVSKWDFIITIVMEPQQ